MTTTPSRIASAGCWTAGLTLAAALGLTSQPARAQVTLLDFQFDEAAGTPLVELPDGSPIPGATIPGTSIQDGSGNGNLFTVSVDDPADLTYERTPDRLLGIQTTGGGRLHVNYAGGFDGDRSSTAFVALNTPITPALYSRAVLTLDVDPWTFEDESSVDDEFFRIGFGDTSATNVTAQFQFIVRDTPDANGLTGIALNADANGDGATETGTLVVPALSLNQAQAVRFEIELDYLTNSYEVRWQQASDPTPTVFFTGSVGSDLGVVRDANFIRFTIDDAFTDDAFFFDRLTVVAFPVSAGIAGDYNNSGLVEQGDLDLVLLNWGADGTTPPTGWVNDLPTGLIDQAELDGVLLNWGNAAEPAGSAVPEPASAVIAGLGALAMALRRRGVV